MDPLFHGMSSNGAAEDLCVIIKNDSFMSDVIWTYLLANESWHDLHLWGFTFVSSTSQHVKQPRCKEDTHDLVYAFPNAPFSWTFYRNRYKRSCWGWCDFRDSRKRQERVAARKDRVNWQLERWLQFRLCPPWHLPILQYHGEHALAQGAAGIWKIRLKVRNQSRRKWYFEP